MILGNVGGLAGTWSGFLGYIIGPYRVLPESDYGGFHIRIQKYGAHQQDKDTRVPSLRLGSP